MKSSVKKFRIDKKKHSQLLASLVVIFVIQVALMIAMVTADETDVSTQSNSQFLVFMTRFACINALHLQLVPEFAKSQRLMNFANNNPEEFRQSRIPFVIGLIQFLISLFSEIVNLWLLQSYDDVFRCIIHYVTMAVVCDLSKIYYAALGAD